MKDKVWKLRTNKFLDISCELRGFDKSSEASKNGLVDINIFES